MADGAPARAQDPYRPLELRTRLVVALLACEVVIAALGAVSAAVALVGSLDGDPDPRAFARVVALSWLWFAGVLVTGAAFLAWLWRAYGNLPALGANQPYEPAWVLWSWNWGHRGWWQPRRIVLAVWEGSDPDEPEGATRSFDQRPPRLVDVWWVLWLPSLLVLLAAVPAEVAELYGLEWRRWSSLAAALSFVLLCAALGAGVSLALVARRISARQRARAARLGVSGASRPRARLAAPPRGRREG